MHENKNLSKINSSQKIAVESALKRSLTLIQGPPGTGKTSTSAVIVYHLVKQNKGKVLVTASSNTAVDNLTDRILKTGVKVVQIDSKGREKTNSEKHTLHEQVKLIIKER
ncbi:Regulator of nonsense transcripts 1 like protein, partial [Dictyocoela muelleri]